MAAELIADPDVATEIAKAEKGTPCISAAEK